MAIPLPLSGSVEGSYAYYTIRDRLPTYLTKVINHLCQDKFTIANQYGQGSLEEIKEIVGKLSEMKNHLQTNKPIKPNHQKVDKKHDDSHLWNEDIEAFRLANGDYPKWFTASWLFVECYFYKKIHQAFQQSKIFNSYDPFGYQKILALENSLLGLKSLCLFTQKALNNLQDDHQWIRAKLSIIFQLSLWGNQCDLSHPNMEHEHEATDLIGSLTLLKSNILHCDMDEIFQYLEAILPDKRQVGIVLDNSGFELVADLFLMMFLLESKMVNSFSIYTKTRPYFISDTTNRDFYNTLDRLREEGGPWIEFCKSCSQYLQDGRWTLIERIFWTSGRPYSSMQDKDCSLYNELSKNCLLIFKGDLNYRKLVGDLDWPHETPLKTSLRGFLPCPLVTLRTIKGGPVVGVDVHSPNYLKAKEEPKWDASGNYGLIQFVSSL